MNSYGGKYDTAHSFWGCGYTDSSLFLKPDRYEQNHTEPDPASGTYRSDSHGQKSRPAERRGRLRIRHAQTQNRRWRHRLERPPVCRGGDFEGPVSASNITQDANHRFVSDAEKTTWNGKASTAVATRSANGLMSAADKKKLDVIPTQGLISSSTMTLGSTLKLSSNVSYLEGRGYVSYIREIGRTQTSFAIDSTIPAGSAPLQIIELVLRCIAGLENNLTISLLLAGDAANSSIAIPKGSKLITLSFMMLNGHIDKYSCYRVSVI